jgi:heterodisulfide reductase subunit B
VKKKPEEKAPLSQYLLYLGCTVPVRALQYEISARKVAERLGIQIVDIPEFSCCGYPINRSITMLTS